MRGSRAAGEGKRGPVVTEFSRQADAMADAPAFQDAPGLARIVRAVRGAHGDRVLDLACGPGVVTEAIAPSAEEVVGIDVAPAMLRLAEVRCRKAGQHNCCFHVATAERLPFANATFGAVVTRLSLHHFGSPDAVLAEARRVVRPDGTLVIADIVTSSVADEARLHNALERLRDPTHLRMQSPRELEALIAAAPFEIVYKESWQQTRTFSEWAAIVACPERTEPLEIVVRTLARAGLRAGIQLEEVDGEIRFRHMWQLIVARPART